MSILNHINNIKELSGNTKIDYLKKLKTSNKEFLEFLSFAELVLDPMLSFHIQEIIPTESSLFDSSRIDRTEIYELLNEFNTKGSANGKDKLELSLLYALLSSDDKELVDMVLARTLRCGLSIKNIQKVQKDFLPEFPVMKCSAYDIKKIQKNIKFPAISQLKSDGAYCCIINSKTMHSRNGKQYHGLDFSYPETQYILCGELVVVDADDVILERKIGNGILNKSIKDTINSNEASRVRYIVWDCLTDNEFYGKVKSVSYAERFNRLSSMALPSNITVTPTKLVNNLDEAADHFRELTKQGQEGTILKSKDNIWKAKRVTDQIKFKETFECEMKIVGWYYGKSGSKYEHCIGGLNLESEDGLVKCNVGSGLIDNDRGVKCNDVKEFADSYINKICTIEYNARVTSENNKTESLFLPRFIELRLDKSYANTLADLKQQEESTRAIGELR